MPIYEFICKKCDEKFETLVRSTDTSSVECPQCGSKELKKLLSSFAAKVESSAASGCANADICPAAGSHCCGGSCGCGHHH